MTRRRRRWWIAAWTVSGAIVAITVLIELGDRAPVCRVALIPAYVPPAELTALTEDPPGRRVVIVNPASGSGGAPDPRYQDAVRRLTRSGVSVLGYVPTGYGQRPPIEAKADVDRYRDWYGVTGIFLDEASPHERDLARYRDLAGYARAQTGRPVVLNPGVMPAAGYFDIADVVVTFEGTYVEYRAALDRGMREAAGIDPRKRGVLVYAANRTQALDAIDRTTEVGFMYVTSGTAPNPWRTLPRYFAEAEEAIVTSTPFATRQDDDACAST